MQMGVRLQVREAKAAGKRSTAAGARGAAVFELSTRRHRHHLFALTLARQRLKERAAGPGTRPQPLRSQ